MQFIHLLFFLLRCYAHTLPSSGVTSAAPGLVSELLVVMPIFPGVTAALAVSGRCTFSVRRHGFSVLVGLLAWGRSELVNNICG